MDPAVDKVALAARIGARYASLAIVVGLAFAALIFLLVDSWDPHTVFRLMDRWPIQTFICVVLGPVIGHWFGKWAGVMILVKRWNAFGISWLIGMASVLLITLLFSLIAFVDEGLTGGSTVVEAAIDYLWKPFFWTSVFGAPVIALVTSVMALFFIRARRKFDM